MLLAGCGSPQTSSTASQPTIELWYEVGLPIADTIKSLVDAYNATGPAVRVVAEPQPDLSVKLLVVMGAHDAPEVVIYPRSRAWPLVSRGAAFPLTDFARRDNVTEALFSPLAWQAGMYKNALWGLPLGMDGTVLATNPALLSAAKVTPTPEWTTSAFDAACTALVKRDDHGNLLQAGAILSQGPPFQIWLWQQGTDLLTANGTAPAFDSPAGLKALNWLLANQQLNGGPQGIGRLVSLTTLTEGIPGVLTHGKLGMLPTTYGDFSRLISQHPKLPLGLATLPTLDGGQPATLYDGIYAFSPQQSAHPHPEGTWQFMRWLATDPHAQARLFAGGTIPASLAAQQAPDVASSANAKVMLQALAAGRVPQDFLWTSQVSSQVDVVVQQALNGQATAQQALDKAKAQAQHDIQQGQAMQ